jgi:hypothetical protein
MKICPVGAELFRAERTDMTKQRLKIVLEWFAKLFAALK